MELVPEVVEQVASEVVLQLVLDRDIRVAPEQVATVEREVGIVMRLALLREDARSRLARHDRRPGVRELDAEARRYAAFLRTSGTSGRGMLSVVETMIAFLRSSPSVPEVCSDDDTLIRKILSVIARPARRRARKLPSGGAPPSSGGPAGCLPAEVRAWHVPRGPTPTEPDPERRERGGTRMTGHG